MDVEDKRQGVLVLSTGWEKSRKPGLPLRFLSASLLLYNFKAHTLSLKSRLLFACGAVSNNTSIWRNLGWSSAAYISSRHPLNLRNGRKGADGWVSGKKNRVLQSGPFLVKWPLLSALGVFYLFQLILEALGSFLSDLLSRISAEKQQFLFGFSFSIHYTPVTRRYYLFFDVKYRIWNKTDLVSWMNG